MTRSFLVCLALLTAGCGGGGSGDSSEVEVAEITPGIAGVPGIIQTRGLFSQVDKRVTEENPEP